MKFEGTMKIISIDEYEKLRGRGATLIGRALKDIENAKPIYFQIDEDQKGLSCTEILDTLSLSMSEITSGDYIVFRYWCSPEIKKIPYKI